MQNIAQAFISCSLRQEDKAFVDFIESILLHFGIKPFGTVGRYSTAPVNTATLMKVNIPLADFVVIVATTRYLQRDIHTGAATSGLSEMVHVESGMAYASNKPIIAFVQEGTNVGNFLPSVTQYITLNGTNAEFFIKRTIIKSMLDNTTNIVNRQRQQKSSSQLNDVVKSSLAVIGVVKLIESFSTDEKPKRKKRKSHY